MSGVLAAAELVYRAALYHYALMLNNPFSRGWCLYEAMVRLLAALRALGLARPEDLVPLILRRDPLLTRLVIVPGLTDVYNDVSGKYFDRFGEMSTFDPADRVRIQAAIVEACGSPAAFNLLISSFRSAASQHLRLVNPESRARARWGR